MSSKSSACSPKQINEIARAISIEVRDLLDEVGRLRDQRRQLQYEIAQIMSGKSQHGAGGEYVPDWRPYIQSPPPPEEAPPPAMPEIPEAKPGGWRVVDKRPPRKARTTPKKIEPPPPAAPVFEVPPPRQNTPAWAQWRPNPLLAPTPPVAPSAAPTGPPPRSGLFGASTPPPGGR